MRKITVLFFIYLNLRKCFIQISMIVYIQFVMVTFSSSLVTPSFWATDYFICEIKISSKKFDEPNCCRIRQNRTLTYLPYHGSYIASVHWSSIFYLLKLLLCKKTTLMIELGHCNLIQLKILKSNFFMVAKQKIHEFNNFIFKVIKKGHCFSPKIF